MNICYNPNIILMCVLFYRTYRNQAFIPIITHFIIIIQLSRAVKHFEIFFHKKIKKLKKTLAIVRKIC